MYKEYEIYTDKSLGIVTVVKDKSVFNIIGETTEKEIFNIIDKIKAS